MARLRDKLPPSNVNTVWSKHGHAQQQISMDKIERHDPVMEMNFDRVLVDKYYGNVSDEPRLLEKTLGDVSSPILVMDSDEDDLFLRDDNVSLDGNDAMHSTMRSDISDVLCRPF